MLEHQEQIERRPEQNDKPSEDDEITEPIESEQKDQKTDVAKYKIISYGIDMTLENVVSNFRQGEIVIPSFQRRFVWTLNQASKLIESFLLGLPIPQIFLYKEKNGEKDLVVDGQQRLRSIKSFFEGTFQGEPFILKNVHSQWEGKKFEGLDERDKRKLKMSLIKILRFEQLDPKDNSSVFEIFERLNTGGTKLSFQEVRNCIVTGEITDFLEELNENKTWREILNKDDPDKRMKDIEMIIRFFALYDKHENYEKPMKEFITAFMRAKKDLNPEEKEIYKNLFVETIEKINTDIGPKAFRLNEKGGRINIAVFDSVMTAIATIKPENISDLKTKYDKLLESEDYRNFVTKATTDDKNVKGRIKMALNTLK